MISPNVFFSEIIVKGVDQSMIDHFGFSIGLGMKGGGKTKLETE